jgi:phosphotriesterase-related protein
MKNNRRTFLKKAVGVTIATSLLPEISLSEKNVSLKEDYLMTVQGEIKASEMGMTLSHEHILVDFIGAAQYDPGRWDHDDVIRIVMPYLKDIMDFGCRTFIECTPAYIGRDPLLLKKLSDLTGMNILTNTGYYGASDNKYIPESAFSADAQQLAGLWIKEFKSGINGTNIKPGFMKIGVSPGPLSEFHQKIVTAAGIAHLETGLTIASHTGPAIPAFEEIDLLRSLGILPDAFIWVHAQNEEEVEKRLDAARLGAWVSLDGLNSENVSKYIEWLKGFKENGLLNKVLVSHDAGWYSPGEPNGGKFVPFSTVFKSLVPGLQRIGFSDKEIRQILSENPASAFSIRVRKA